MQVLATNLDLRLKLRTRLHIGLKFRIVDLSKISGIYDLVFEGELAALLILLVTFFGMEHTLEILDGGLLIRGEFNKLVEGSIIITEVGSKVAKS